jgi:hypothetical protein
VLNRAMQDFASVGAPPPIVRPLSPPQDVVYPTLNTPVASSNSSASSSSASTTEYRSLAGLMSQPTVFRDLYVMRTSNTLSTLISQVLFVSETKRWLELVHGASADSQRSLLDRTKLSLDDIIEHQLVSGVFQPAYFLAVDNALRSIVLAIRSTKSFSDLLTDYTYTPVPYDDGWAHDGMTRAAHWFSAHVLPRLAQLRDAYPRYRVRVVGHSLGAGVATLVGIAARRQAALADTEVVVFAPPACVW